MSRIVNVNGVSVKLSGSATVETDSSGKKVINLDGGSSSKSKSGGGSSNTATIITPISESGERGVSSVYANVDGKEQVVASGNLPSNVSVKSVRQTSSGYSLVLREQESNFSKQKQVQELTAQQKYISRGLDSKDISSSNRQELINLQQQTSSQLNFVNNKPQLSSRQSDTFFNAKGEGFSQASSITPSNFGKGAYGYQEVTYYDGSKRTEFTGYSKQFTEQVPIKPIVKESFINKVDRYVDYPVTLTQKSLVSFDVPKISFAERINIYTPSERRTKVYNTVGSLGIDVGSYFTPYYGKARFVKDIGVYGYNVAKNPSYAVNEGKYETLGLIGVVGLYGGSKAYSKFVRNPKISDFAVVKQTSQIKFFETKTSKSNIVKYTETNQGFVVGVDPLARNQILKELKLTSMTKRVKGIKTSFDISDKSFGVSRKGTRELFMDLDTGYSKTVDVFDVSRFGKPYSYVKITDSSSQGFSTNVYKLGSKNSKPIMSITGKSPNLSFTVGRLPKEVKSSESISSKKLSSSDSVSRSYSKIVGSKDYAFRVDVSQSRKLSQQVKLSKYYSVESNTELGIVLDSKGVSSLRPVSSSKTYKNILQFGEDYSFNANKYLTKDYSIVSYKNPTVLETTYTLEDVNLKFTKLPKSESKYLFKQEIKSRSTYNIKDKFVSLLKSKKGSLTLSTPEIKFKTDKINEYNFISVPKKSVSSSLSYLNLESSIVPTSKISSSFTPISFSSFNYRNDISPKSNYKSIISPKYEISPKLQYSLRSSSNSDISLKNEYKSIVSPKLKVNPIVKSKSISRIDSIQIPVSKSILSQKYKSVLSPMIESKSKVRSSYFTSRSKPSIFIPFMYNNKKTPVIKSSVFKTLSPKSFSFSGEKYSPLASLPEVFSYEAKTGKESFIPKSKKSIKTFRNQLFGKGNFFSIVRLK